MAGTAVVSSLFVYPVKSCRGISVHEAVITPTGFQWDRQWMVVSADTGRFISQRQEPLLSLVTSSLPPDALLPSARTQLPPDASLVLTAPGMLALKIPLSLEAYATKLQASVWEWSGEALDAGPEAASWFSTYLGRSCRVVRFNTGQALRPTEAEFAPGYETAFSDGFPYLLSSQASLDSLNSKLSAPVTIQRFRPNILVDSCSIFEEDKWRTLRIGTESGREFFAVKPCGRCKIPSVDPDTGRFVADKEPLTTLATFRTAEKLELTKPFPKKEVFFGINLVCHFESGKVPPASTVSVGDAIAVTKSAEKIGSLLGVNI